MHHPRKTLECSGAAPADAKVWLQLQQIYSSDSSVCSHSVGKFPVVSPHFPYPASFPNPFLASRNELFPSKIPTLYGIIIRTTGFEYTWDFCPEMPILFQFFH